MISHDDALKAHETIWDDIPASGEYRPNDKWKKAYETLETYIEQQRALAIVRRENIYAYAEDGGNVMFSCSLCLADWRAGSAEAHYGDCAAKMEGVQP